MKVTFTTNNGRMTAEFDVDTQTDLFEQLAYFQEIFGEEQCAKCGSENLRFQVRKVEDNLYYELKCVDCGAKLAFGTMKVGADSSQDARTRKETGYQIVVGLSGIRRPSRKSSA